MMRKFGETAYVRDNRAQPVGRTHFYVNFYL